MKIKPCPFCGREPKLEHLKKDRLDTLDSMGNPPMFHRCKDGWRIECNNLKCGVRPSIFLANFESDTIIKIWNERENPT